MRVYLASRYQRREEMKGHRDYLQNILGHEVTARWLDFEDEHPEAAAGVEADEAAHVRDDYREMISLMDIADIIAADCLVLFTPAGTRGGCNVEWGVAVALGKQLVLVGVPGNVFHYVPDATKYEDPEQFLLSFGAATGMIASDAV